MDLAQLRPNCTTIVIPVQIYKYDLLQTSSQSPCLHVTITTDICEPWAPEGTRSIAMKNITFIMYMSTDDQDLDSMLYRFHSSCTTLRRF